MRANSPLHRLTTIDRTSGDKAWQMIVALGHDEALVLAKQTLHSRTRWSSWRYWKGVVAALHASFSGSS